MKTRIFEEYENATYEYTDRPKWSTSRAEKYASAAAWQSEQDDLLRVAVIDGTGKVTRVFDWKAWQHGRQPTDAERHHFESLAAGTGDPYNHPPIPSGHEKPEFHQDKLYWNGPYDIVEVAMPDTDYEELIDRLRVLEEELSVLGTEAEAGASTILMVEAKNLCLAVRAALSWRLEEEK